MGLDFTSIGNPSHYGRAFPSSLMQTDLQLPRTDSFVRTIGDQQALKTNGEGSLNFLKLHEEGRGEKKKAICTLHLAITNA